VSAAAGAPGDGGGRAWRPEALGYAPAAVAVPDGVLQAAHVVWRPSYRVIASEYAGENLFDRLQTQAEYAAALQELADLRAIADLTNAAVRHAAGEIDLVRAEDRVFGPRAGLIMAAFAYPRGGSRFCDGQSGGAYYAAQALETAVRETVYHAEQLLRGTEPCTLEKTVIEATLDAELVDVRAGCPTPLGVYDPADYSAGQAFAGMVRRLGGFGIVYDSVRHTWGTCAAVLRPPALSRAVAAQTLRYDWDGARVAGVR
jgi:hypothetical protein